MAQLHSIKESNISTKPKKRSMSISGIIGALFLFILFCIEGYFTFVFPHSQAYVSPYVPVIQNPPLKRYPGGSIFYSHELRVTFSFAPTDGQNYNVKQVDTIAYVYPASYSGEINKTLPFVQAIPKLPEYTLQTAVTKAFHIQNSCTFVSSKTDLSYFPKSVVTTSLLPQDPANPQQCPAAYSQALYGGYFLMDTQYPSMFYFVSPGAISEPNAGIPQLPSQKIPVWYLTIRPF